MHLFKTYITGIFTFFLFQSIAFCQQKDYTFVENRMKNIPDSALISPEALASFITGEYSDDIYRLRAAFSWIGHNIDYDIEMIDSSGPNLRPDERALITFNTRRGVCQGYSDLFCKLCSLMNIHAVEIGGYSMQNRQVSDVAHAWVAVYLDGKWYCNDPTWAAGVVMEDSFQKMYSAVFFMMPPDLFIKTHMPFDPLWQLMKYPITNNEFYKRDFTAGKNRPVFYFNDSIGYYEQLPEPEKTLAAANRIKGCGLVNNSVIKDYNIHLKNAEIYRQNTETDKRNQMVYRFNHCAAEYNRMNTFFNAYIDAKNHQFSPDMKDAAIQALMDSCTAIFDDIRERLKAISPGDTEFNSNLNKFNKQMAHIEGRIKEEKAFLKKYFATSRPLRKALFYK